MELGATCFLYANGKHWGTCRLDVKGAIQVGITHKNLSTDARHRGGHFRISDEVSVMEMELRDLIAQFNSSCQPNLERTVE